MAIRTSSDKWREHQRWIVAAMAVLLAHGLAVGGLLYRPDLVTEQGGSPVVLLELAPELTSPETTRSELAPGPQQIQSG